MGKLFVIVLILWIYILNKISKTLSNRNKE
jgi:F0F1-type ATP synthase membrane subunit b/b'